MWHYVLNDQQHGPVSAAELRDLLARQVINQETLVWRTGTRNWLKISELDLTPPDATPEDIPPHPITPVPEGARVCAFSGLPLKESDSIRIDGFEVADEHRAEAEAYVQSGGWLPTARSGLRPVGNLDIAHVLPKAMALVKSCAAPASALFLLVHIPLAIAFAHVEPIQPFGQITPEQARALMLSVVFGNLASGGCLFLFRQHSRGDRAGFQRALFAAFALWGPVLATLVGTVLCVAVGAFPLIIPGMIIGIRLALAMNALVDRNLSPFGAFKHSWSVTRDYAMHTFGFMLIIMVGIGLPLELLGVAVSSLITGLVHWILPGVDVAIVDSVLAAVCGLPTILCAACVYCYFKELEARYLASTPEQP